MFSNKKLRSVKDITAIYDKTKHLIPLPIERQPRRSSYERLVDEKYGLHTKDLNFLSLYFRIPLDQLVQVSNPRKRMFRFILNVIKMRNSIATDDKTDIELLNKALEFSKYTPKEYLC